MDNAEFSACSSPISYANLVGGAHSFQVRAVDAAGNVDDSEELFTWFVSGNKFK